VREAAGEAPRRPPTDVLKTVDKRKGFRRYNRVDSVEKSSRDAGTGSR
jgi:hypothetical protein